MAPTIGDTLDVAVPLLKHVAAEPDVEAAFLLGHALTCSAADVVGRSLEPLTESAAAWFRDAIDRRVAGESLAYIVGYVLYRGLRIAVDERVMVPRSSILVDVAVSEIKGACVHDVGTGSGAIALAIKHERPDLVVSGSDISEEAVAVARANARALGLSVEFFVADGVPRGSFDLLVANLPYLTRSQRQTFLPGLEREPDLANIVAGNDPLEVIRSVVAHARSGMRVALQHPLDLAADVSQLLAEPRLVSSHQRPSATVGRLVGLVAPVARPGRPEKLTMAQFDERAAAAA